MRGKCRVVLACPDLLATPGGMASCSRALVESHALRFLGFDVTPLTTHREGNALAKLAIFVGAISRLITARRRFDILHLQVAGTTSVERKATLMVLAKVLRLPVVAQLHTAALVGDYEGRGRLRRYIFRRFMQNADAVMVLGKAMRDWLVSIVPAANVRIVPNFVHVTEDIEPLPSQFQLAFVGRIGERKGAWVLLAALRRLAERGVCPLTVLVGDGELERAREHIATEVGDHVKLLGWRTRDDVREVVRRSTVVVLPSMAEAMPMAILEAMAEARPVIATPVGAIAEVVRSKETGLLCRPGDAAGLAAAIEYCMENPSAVQRMADAAYRHAARHYSEGRVVERLGRIYLECLDHSESAAVRSVCTEADAYH
jgi:glycosyltransferase involved in cell wall biosynthesis